jgi:hypothetical protein
VPLLQQVLQDIGQLQEAHQDPPGWRVAQLWPACPAAQGEKVASGCTGDLHLHKPALFPQVRFLIVAESQARNNLYSVGFSFMYCSSYFNLATKFINE